MIDLYTWSTPNGRKVSIALEESGLEYEAHPVNIGADEQFHPDFLKISPNNKIPAIVDRDNGLSLMESGAILLYLAEKTGKFMPRSGERRWRVVEWLMWQMGGAGPMLGQVHHFVKFNPGKSEYAERRFRTEADRLYGVMNDRLADCPYLAGDEYTIADMAVWPWVSRYEWQEIDFSDFPNVRRCTSILPNVPRCSAGTTCRRRRTRSRSPVDPRHGAHTAPAVTGVAARKIRRRRRRCRAVVIVSGSPSPTAPGGVHEPAVTARISWAPSTIIATET